MSFVRNIAFVGLILSLYAIFVEYKMHHLRPGEEFTALCDIDALQASCSTVFTLPVGKLLSYSGLVPRDSLLDLPNAVVGFLYYSWVLLFVDMPMASFRKYLNPLVSSLAMLTSLFLAYQLTVVLKELCVLCWSTHVINAILFYQIAFKRRLSGVKSKRKSLKQKTA
ncbi:hypothetical protein MPSEU_000411800 [Mayamaea pseudoterrestris]|nr:hypothetical protein MPSEU_000411800 [Mayamaea pseudoterrestris]